MKESITLAPEVKKALDENRPVIALESTLIAHGFPYPENYKLALEMETMLREEGVIPATIAILDGRIKIGLAKEEIKYIATSNNIHKASLRDIPVLIAKNLDGGTTVAGTMAIANLTGIKIFVTGGIGGVHHGVNDSFDISADLQALSKYNVTVISAGAKSILDLSKTKERLETLGVPVLGYKTDKFPAFYLRDSGVKVDYSVNSIKEIVKIMNTRETLAMQGGLLVTIPIPEEDELDSNKYNHILEKALVEVENKGIKGKDVTPYLLQKIKEETKGKSVEANIALIMNNLRLGIEIAKKYYQ